MIKRYFPSLTFHTQMSVVLSHASFSHCPFNDEPTSTTQNLSHVSETLPRWEATASATLSASLMHTLQLSEFVYPLHCVVELSSAGNFKIGLALATLEPRGDTRRSMHASLQLASVTLASKLNYRKRRREWCNKAIGFDLKYDSFEFPQRLDAHKRIHTQQPWQGRSTQELEELHDICGPCSKARNIHWKIHRKRRKVTRDEWSGLDHDML